MKRKSKILLAAVLIYAALLILLTMAEQAAPGATIHGLPDALWFSLVTMTTVGYGDMAPVTTVGRVIGAIFALCSIGLLSVLIGIALNLLGGRWIPMLRLRLGKKNPWYVFDEENRDTAAFAEKLRQEERGGLLVFPKSGEKLLSGPDVVHLDLGPKQLLHLRGTTDGLSVFCMSGEPWRNLEQGIQTAGLHIPTYVMAEAGTGGLPPELHLFSRSEALSRCYWSRFPVTPEEKRILIIGCGTAGSAILERALLTNIFEPERKLEYHVFGDSAPFVPLHPAIVEALSGRNPEEDSLTFHEENWTEARALIETADRILFCSDEDTENLRASETLRRWFVTDAKIHLRLSEPVSGAVSFGERAEILTPEFVMRDEINRQAMLLNSIYNRGSDRPTAWRDLSHFLQQSNIAAADHLVIKARLLLPEENVTDLTKEICRRAYERYLQREEDRDLFQRIEHRRWMRFYQMYNWQQDPVRDDRHRRHPMLLPYAELSDSEQRKDAYAWELLGQLYENTSDGEV